MSVTERGAGIGILGSGVLILGFIVLGLGFWVQGSEYPTTPLTTNQTTTTLEQALRAI